MNLAIAKIAIFLVLLINGKNNLQIVDETRFGFKITPHELFENKIKMFCSLLDENQNSIQCDYNNSIDFHDVVLPLDIYCYFLDKGDEAYYTLLTKTAYGINRDVSFFTSERLSDESYLQSVMPYNKLSRTDTHYDLKVGFGAPDISYTLDFYDNEKLNRRYPGLVEYFNKYDKTGLESEITVIQHNFQFSKILGQKTSKMSISITRYFDNGKDQTLAINYTLNFIHNLPPAIFGGADLLVNQMKDGVIALVRDTRNVCEAKLD